MNIIPTPKYKPGQVVRYVDKYHGGTTKYSVSEGRIVSVVAEYVDSGVYRAYESSYKTGRENEIEEGIHFTFRYKFSLDLGFEPGTWTSEGILESQIIELSSNQSKYVPVKESYITYPCESKSIRKFILQGSGTSYRDRDNHLYEIKDELKSLGCKWNGNNWIIETYPDSDEFNALSKLGVEFLG